jgi:hypothetical protein
MMDDVLKSNLFKIEYYATSAGAPYREPRDLRKTSHTQMPEDYSLPFLLNVSSICVIGEDYSTLKLVGTDYRYIDSLEINWERMYVGMVDRACRLNRTYLGIVYLLRHLRMLV